MEDIYLKRKIDDFLIRWKSNPDKKPLIIKGARQVGKTESIKHFADGNYESIININFVEEPKYKGITDDGFKVENIIKNSKNVYFVVGKYFPYRSFKTVYRTQNPAFF